jgi:hypothetical protein
MSPKRAMKNRPRPTWRSRWASSSPKIAIGRRSLGSRSSGTWAAQEFSPLKPLK